MLGLAFTFSGSKFSLMTLSKTVADLPALASLELGKYFLVSLIVLSPL
jgi:hypothetical protein